jgi:hypothetical protein
VAVLVLVQDSWAEVAPALEELVIMQQVAHTTPPALVCSLALRLYTYLQMPVLLPQQHIFSEL